MRKIKKSEFTQQNILELTTNKSILVECSNFKEIESTCNMVSLAKKRFPDLDKNFKTERNLEDFTLLITAIPKQTTTQV